MIGITTRKPIDLDTVEPASSSDGGWVTVGSGAGAPDEVGGPAAGAGQRVEQGADQRVEQGAGPGAEQRVEQGAEAGGGALPFGVPGGRAAGLPGWR